MVCEPEKRGSRSWGAAVCDEGMSLMKVEEGEKHATEEKKTARMVGMEEEEDEER